MNDVLKIFFSMSFSGSLLILLLFLCRHFLKNKMSRQWQYYVWLIVIARLLLPFTPEISFVGSLFQTAENTVYQTDIPDFIGEFHLNLQDINNSASNKESSTFPLTESICLIWLVTALVLFIRKITIYQSFVRYIKAGQHPVSDIRLLDQLALIGEEAGIKNAVELSVNPLISSPLLIGFFHPHIVLPGTELSDRDFRYTILHELTHYHRWDMFYKWLVQITLCLHWFNPLVYLMSHEINHACEFSCDEALLAKIGSNHAKEYGETLLNAMAKSGHYKEALASLSLNESKKTLKERMEAIMNFTKKSKTAVFGGITLTLLLCAGAFFLGAYTSPSKQAAEKPPVSSSTPLKTPLAEEQVNSSTVPPQEKPAENMPGTSTALPQEKPSESMPDSPASSSSTQDADMEAISVMESSGTWGENIERLLPDMSEKAIEMMLIVYVEKHIFSGISTDEDVTRVRKTIEPAYSYLSEKSIETIETYMKSLL